MATLKKTMYLDGSNLARTNRALKSRGYPEVTANYVSNIMSRLGGADNSSQGQVYEIISVALGFDLVDSEGYEYIPSWI